ncbi:MAG: flavin reductase family protein [Candidatus Hodarchaeales archaeon]|jgi:flavin reductase (DIM6/NTAB) family NADH-FMN oxidoreductase RutF
MKLSNIDLKTAYRFLYPRFTVIVSSGTLSNPNALAIAWSTPLSVDPPLIGILIANRRYSHEIIKKEKCFVVNIPDFTLVEETHYIGRISGREEPDKIEKAGFTLEASKKISAPCIRECKINLGCILKDIISTGDHDMFIGEIIEIAVESNIRDEWSFDPSEFQAVYWRQSKFSSDTYRLKLKNEEESI